jgi:type II secretory pathway pseudopilin PulG
MVELLAVIAIMSVLLTMGAIGLGGISGGKSVGSAVANTEALFAEARSIATGKATKARVLVKIGDPGDKENYLRRILIAYQEVNPVTSEPVEDSWILSSRGYLLPEKVFFSRTYSRAENNAGLNEMTLTASNNVHQTYAGEYAYYEFTSGGICTTPGASFIVGSGVLRPGTDEPIVSGSAKRDFGGFVIWRNGNTSMFRSPEQMQISDTSTTF